MLNQEMKAAHEAAMANPKLAKKMEEVIAASESPAQADAVEEAASNADLPTTVAKINEVIAALKASGLMSSQSE